MWVDYMFNETFQRLTGFPPYPYQLKVAETLLSGQSTLLVAPTGSGKTWAAVAPYIHTKLNHTSGENGQVPFADRLVYALPLRALASSLHGDVVDAAKRAFGDDRVIVSGKDRDYRRQDIIHITLQTGECQDDTLFEGDIIFTTIDQLLSSYLNVPLSLPRKLSNINAGSLIGAYIVLDEFHLLEEKKSLSTSIEMIDRLRDYSTFMVMTATLSNPGCDRLSSLLGLKRIELCDKERLALPAESKRHRAWQFISSSLDASAILSTHKRRTIALCNTVGRAQELYRNLRESCPQGTSVLLLHSRFYPEDRARIEAEVVEKFGKHAHANDSIILVTTQVIEAGMDISCEVLHTEIAPVNSIIQRAGRCARYGGQGLVSVYELPEPDKTAPYDRKLVDKTRDVLSKECTLTDFALERRLIDAVHGEPEAHFLDSFSIYAHREEVAKAMAGDNPGAISSLIRDIDNLQIIVTDKPGQIEFTPRKWPVSLSVPRSSLFKLVKDELTDGLIWSAEVKDSESNIWMGMGWRDVKNHADILGAWLVAVHPDIAEYSTDTGLTLGVCGAISEVRYIDRPPLPLYSYRAETFTEHAKKSLSAFEAILYLYECGLRKFAFTLNVNAADLISILNALVALHDAGKLTEGWQSFASSWQKIKKPHQAVLEPLAHTDYDPLQDAEAIRKVPPRPPHAAEGAFSLGDFLFSDLRLKDGIAVAAITAIARHHSGRTSTVREFKLVKEANQIAAGLLKHEAIKLRMPANTLECEQFSRYLLIDPQLHEHEPFLPLYWFFVRLIRLSDQTATKEVNKLASLYTERDRNVC